MKTTADEVLAEVLTEEQVLDMALGKPVYVTMTREQHETIEADPLRQLTLAWLDAASTAYADRLSRTLLP